VRRLVEVLLSKGIAPAARPCADPDHRVDRLRGGGVLRGDPHRADSGAAGGVLIGAATNDVDAARATLVDVAEVIDEEVVADVAPAAADGVVVVDRAKLDEWIPEAGRVRVVDDDVLAGAILGGPAVGAGVNAAVGESSAPLIA